MEKVVKWKAIIMGRDETRGSSGKKALNRQIFMVGYLQFVKTKHLNAALCSTGYGASTVASNCTGGCPGLIPHHSYRILP